MPLKQAAFNFDVEPEETLPVENTAPAVANRQVNEPSVHAEPVVLEEEQELKKNLRGRHRTNEMTDAVSMLTIPDDAVLAQKNYYSIGEVANMFNVNHSLLRYWETEFNVFKLKKNGKGDRFYRPEDIKNLKLIYHLLRERKYTIEGAREFMKNNKQADNKFELINSLKSLKNFLNELKANL